MKNTKDLLEYNCEQHTKTNKERLINFSSDYKRMIAEFSAFALIMIFLEIVAAIPLKYIPKFQYIFMFFIVISFIFITVNIFKKWQIRFVIYSAVSIFCIFMSMINVVYISYKHDGASVSMISELQMGIEFATSRGASDYLPSSVYGNFCFAVIVLLFLSLLALLFTVCFRNNREKTILYPRLAIGIISAYFIALPIYSVNFNPFGHLAYDKFYSAQTIGQINYIIQDINSLLYREIVEKNTVSYTPPENINESKTTSFTGMFEGKNVIQIMLEEEETCFIDPVHTPNIYNLMQNGINYTNFYSAYSYLSTYDAEFKSLTSAMGYTCNNYYVAYSNNSYKNSIPSVLSNYGYKTIGMHNYRRNYYRRNKIWENMDFQETYFIEEMQFYKELYPEYTDWYNAFPINDFPLDSLILKNMAQYYAPVGLEQPFYSFVLTIGSHQDYELHRPTLQKYYDILSNDPKYSNYPDYYLNNKVTIMDTDVGIGYMMEYLTENNLLDDTLIIMYTDHHSYSSEEEFAGYRDFLETPWDIFKEPCVIFNPSLQAQQNDMLCSHYDIAPTIFDLLGIKYNCDYYYGQSLFDENRDDRPIIFGAHKWINSKMYAIDFDYVLTDTSFSLPDDYYKEMSNYVWDTIQKFNYFIYTDYFKDEITFIK